MEEQKPGYNGLTPKEAKREMVARYTRIHQEKGDGGLLKALDKEGQRDALGDLIEGVCNRMEEQL